MLTPLIPLITQANPHTLDVLLTICDHVLTLDDVNMMSSYDDPIDACPLEFIEWLFSWNRARMDLVMSPYLVTL